MSSEQTTLLNGRIKLLQSAEGLRASTDSVLLASAVTLKQGESLLDMGCGTGAVGLCVYERFRTQGIKLAGIDIQQKMIEIAWVNAFENNLADKAEYFCGNVHDKTYFKAESFDHIVMNPPYYAEGERTASPDKARETAYTGELEHWMVSATHWLRHGGSLTLIHRADRLDKILALAFGRYGAIEIWPIHSKADEPAIRVIVKMLRNRKTPLKIHPALVLHYKDGTITAQANSILRDAQPLG